MANIAIIETGGKQYLVALGTILKVEKLSRANAKSPLKPGDSIEFDKVLLTDDGTTTAIGKPYINGVVVKAELIEESRHQTVTVIKYRQKSRYFKKRGHRQPYAQVKITALS